MVFIEYLLWVFLDFSTIHDLQLMFYHECLLLYECLFAHVAHTLVNDGVISKFRISRSKFHAHNTLTSRYFLKISKSSLQQEYVMEK